MIDFVMLVRIVSKGLISLKSCCSGHTYTLNNLKHSGPTHHKNEEGEQPRSNRILFLVILIRLWNVPPLSHVLHCLFVGDFHPLLGRGRHDSLVEVNQEII